MPYDRDIHPDNFDPHDHDAVVAFLNDPGKVAMRERMGAMFRDLPADEQISELLTLLRSAVERRDTLAEMLGAEGAPDDDPRQVLLAACVHEVDQLAKRIAELTGPAPDHL